jgi:translation initiation factor 2D
MAVGTCDIDVSSLGSVQGMKGHAVSTFHWAGDELWSWSPAGYQPGSEPPGALQGWDDENDDTSLATQTAGIDLQDRQESDMALKADPAERSDAEKAQGLDGEDPPSIKDAVEFVDDKELSQKGNSHLQKAMWSLYTRLIVSRDRRCIPRCVSLRRALSHGP